MIIQLDRPLCVFDLETTGLDISKDRIVQIAILKIHPDGKKEELNLLINPEMNISESNAAIHGITNEIVKDAPTFKQAAKEIAEFIGESDMAGYNSNKFDIPVLAEEFLRVEFDFDLSSRKCVDVQNIFHKMEQRTLVAAFKFYCSKELDNAHDAMADTTATWEVFEKQIERYGNLKPNIDFLSEFSKAGKLKNADFAGRLAYNEKDEMVYNFGKHSGKTVKEIANSEPGYYGWMLEADFPRYTKKILFQEMEKIKEEKEKKIKRILMRSFLIFKTNSKNENHLHRSQFCGTCQRNECSPTKEPHLFFKPDTAILRTSHFYHPKFSNNIHYECELVIKINKVGKNIQEKFAHTYYSEFTLGIDFTARDLQSECKKSGLPWEIAKGFDSSAPLSDRWLKIEDYKNEIQFSLTKNKKTVQEGNTSQMIFSFDQLICYLSKYITLKKGDLIFTGTPSGVGKVDIGDTLEAFVGNEKLLKINIK